MPTFPSIRREHRESQKQLKPNFQRQCFQQIRGIETIPARIHLNGTLDVQLLPSPMVVLYHWKEQVKA